MALTHRHQASSAKEVILALLNAGANVNELREESDWRGCGFSKSAFEMFLGSPLSDDPDILEAFLKAGADANAARVSHRHSMRTDGMTRSTPLHTAVRKGNVNVVGCLLRAGAKVDECHVAQYHNERGYNENLSVTSLHLAVDSCNLEIVLLLLAEGADPNALARRLAHEDSGQVGTTDDPRDAGYVSPVKCVPVCETALHRAVLAGWIDGVRALLAAGADRNIKRVYGEQSESTDELVARAAIKDVLRCELSNALLTSAGWSQDNHKYFSTALREQVRTVLLVAKAANWALDRDALSQIFVALAARPSAAMDR